MIQITDIIAVLTKLHEKHGNLPVMIETAEDWQCIISVYIKGECNEDRQLKTPHFIAMSCLPMDNLKKQFPGAAFQNNTGRPNPDLDQ